MGVLYYLAKTDGSRELFALNKPWHYCTKALADFHMPRPLPASPDDFLARVIQPDFAEWGRVIAQRLYAWAGAVPLLLVTDHDDYGGLHDGLSYDQHAALITGSARDSDYETDGVTYRPGSAW